ncbi:N-acylneuraminate-9-phosphatase [Megalops cyprinoides]|uniref:N-acylneuraminate-9-phosphatase n=1 Tax=Megalops cyprinoides TaxID=118141 RepID=UPI00186493E4|nr:N-acylneuraminate-9-phosphatase [Megalops cyprinoides]
MCSDGVKAIFFDLDNTLIDTAGANRTAIQKVQELLGTRFGQEDIGSICERFRVKLLQESYEPSEDVTIDDVRVTHWEEAIQEVAGKGPDRTLAAECYSMWKSTRLQLLAIPGPVRALLEDLRETHKLLLLTNGVAQTQREKIEAVRCEGLFHAVVVGGEHAEEKPASSIFCHCFQLLGVGPRDCMMVGDSLNTDILGGANAGVRATVWVNGDGRTAPPEAPVRPDYTIATVLELPTVLAALH